MRIAIDNVQPEVATKYLNVSSIRDLTEKYVRCVDNNIDIIITSNRQTAKFFQMNGIKAYMLTAVS